MVYVIFSLQRYDFSIFINNNIINMKTTGEKYDNEIHFIAGFNKIYTFGPNKWFFFQLCHIKVFYFSHQVTKIRRSTDINLSC